ncbi:MAG: hypothetical protein IT186_25600 [Acidobacteria bacterium]|nr:hypothetical protein [Acidobacteriota bacterium]
MNRKLLKTQLAELCKVTEAWMETAAHPVLPPDPEEFDLQVDGEVTRYRAEVGPDFLIKEQRFRLEMLALALRTGPAAHGRGHRGGTMSWPVCPVCGAPRVARVDTQATRIDGAVTRVRTYRCDGCDWTAETHEVVVTEYPAAIYLRKKFPLIG